jgi:AhpC/TSA family
VVLVDIWEGTEPRPEVERFCEMWGIKGPLLLDPDETLARALGVRGVPTNVVVDSDGFVREFGAARLDELERAIESLHTRA